MKFKHIVTLCMSIAMVAVFSLSIGASAATPVTANAAETAVVQGNASVDEKDEVVYAKLEADGAVESIYTVNHFAVNRQGSLTDYGDYESVVNLTNTDPLTLNGDTVTFDATADNYYYQGNLNTTDLPWILDFAYKLDGTPVQPEALAGQSGKLTLHITSLPNEQVDPTFYDNYMLQITVTLDSEKCANIDAPSGTAANAGANKVIAYTVLPGTDADFTLTADVRDFTMAGVDIAGMPYSMEMEFPDTEDSLSDLEKLPEAIAELNDGVADLKSGTQDMKNGANQLENGSASIRDGLNQLDGNSASLRDASAQINGALGQIATTLNNSGIDNIDLSQVTQLPDGLNQLADGLEQMAGGLGTLKDGYSQAYGTLGPAINAIPYVDGQTINNIYVKLGVASDPDLDALVDAYGAAQTVKYIYGQSRDAFDAVVPALNDTVAGLGKMSGVLRSTATQIGNSLGQLDGLDQLNELASGLNELSAQYTQFDAGLGAYLDGVHALASNYNTFHSGVATFNNGVGELNNGIGELRDGTGTLNDEVADLPDMIQEEIDKMKEDYLPSDFDPVSFTSAKNTNTEFVQFVMQSEPIEKPAAETTATADEEPQEESFWSRLKSLFVKESE